jgi:UDP-glucose 4-epimerase
MRWLVTGGAGFIGTALAQALVDDGHEVVCADRRDRIDRADRVRGARYVELRLGEGRDVSELVEGCHVVAHLAHRGLPSSPPESAPADAGANVRSLLEILEPARRSGVGCVLLASSGGTVYGAVDAVPVDETARCAPISGYGAAKLMLEDWVSYYDRAHGLRGVSLRVGNAVGPGQLRGAGVGAAAKFLADAAADRQIVIWGDGGTVRDYVDVDDIVAAFRAAAASDLSGAVNVGTGVGTSLNQLVEVVGQVAGRDLQVRYEPTRAFDVPAIVLDSGRLTRATGWAPQLDLVESVRRMWQALGG